MARKKTTDDTRRLQLIIPTALFAACEREATKNGEPIAALIRRAMATEVGKPDLAEMRGRGKPKSP